MSEIPQLTLSFWPIVFLIAGGQSLFFSVIIFTTKKQQSANIYLSAFLLFFGYMLVFNFCYWTNYMYHLPHFFYTNIVMNYLFGPLLLLYLDAFRRTPKLQKWWWIHFLPVVIYCLYMSPFYFENAATKLAYIQGTTPYPKPQWGAFNIIGQMGSFKVFAVHLLCYFGWKIHLYNQLIQPSETVDFPEETALIRKKWLKILLSLYAAFLFSYLTYFLIANQPFFELAYDFLISAIMTISIYIISFLGFKRPQIFSGELFKKVFLQEKKYANSSLSKTAAASIEKALEKVMQEERIYQDNDLKIKDLAEKLNSSPHHLSQVINEKFGKSFNQYINEYRIKAAIQLLENPSHKKDHIIQIAYQVGFNNKTTFNSAFKKIAGCSPSQFRQSLKRTNG